MAAATNRHAEGTQRFPGEKNLYEVLSHYEGYVFVLNPDTTGRAYIKSRELVIEIAAKRFAQTKTDAADVQTRTMEIVKRVQAEHKHGALSESDVRDIAGDVTRALLSYNNRTTLTAEAGTAEAGEYLAIGTRVTAQEGYMEVDES